MTKISHTAFIDEKGNHSLLIIDEVVAIPKIKDLVSKLVLNELISADVTPRTIGMRLLQIENRVAEIDAHTINVSSNGVLRVGTKLIGGTSVEGMAYNKDRGLVIANNMARELLKNKGVFNGDEGLIKAVESILKPTTGVNYFRGTIVATAMVETIAEQSLLDLLAKIKDAKLSSGTVDTRCVGLFVVSKINGFSPTPVSSINIDANGDIIASDTLIGSITETGVKLIQGTVPRPELDDLIVYTTKSGNPHFEDL